MKYRCQKLADRTVLCFIIGIMLITIVSFIVCNYVFMSKYSDTFSKTEWFWAIPSALICGVGVLLCKKMKSQSQFLMAGLIISNLIFIAFIFSYNTQPVSDWKMVWTAAKQMANGTFVDGVINGTYMHEIPYQIGLAYLESLVIRIFGENYTVFKVMNIIIMNLILISVYYIAKEKANTRIAGYSFIAASLFLCWSMTVPQFTNHPLGTLFLILTLWFFEKGEYLYSIIAGLSLCLMNFIRPMGIVIVAVFICETIYRLISNKKALKSILLLLLCLCSYWLLSFLVDNAFINMGYSDTRISSSSRNIYHKITYGTYESQVDGHIADFNYNYEEYDRAYKEELIEMVTNHPKEIIVSIANKFCRYLGLFDYGFEMTYNHDINVWTKYPIKAVYSMQWFQYIIYIIIALFGAISYHRKNGTDIFQIFYIGNTLVYLFVEAFTTYRFESYFFLLILVGFGIDSILFSNSTINEQVKLNKIETSQD